MLLSYICAFVEKVTKYREDQDLTNLNRVNYEQVVEIYGRCWSD